MTEIIINKVPGRALYSGGVYQDGKEVFCSACRGVYFGTKKMAKDQLSLMAKISNKRPKIGVIATKKFTYKKVQYKSEYYANNNFRVEPVDRSTSPYDPYFAGRLCSFYAGDADKFPKSVQKFLEETAASFRTDRIILKK